MDIKTEVRQYILEHHLPGETAEGLGDDAPLLTSGILDSIGVLGLINFVEGRYGIEFLPREVDLEKLDTVARIEAIVKGKLSGKTKDK